MDLIQKEGEVLVLIPVGLSKGVVFSQVLNIRELFHSAVDVSFFTLEKGQLVNFFDNEVRIDIKDYIINNNIKLIYTRSQFDFIKCKMLRKCPPIYYDFRGAVFAESFLRNGSYLRSISLFMLDYIIFHLADFRGTVSNNFSIWLKKVFFSNKKVLVIPCCIREVQLVETSLIQGDKFVYVGGASIYQNLELMVELLNGLSHTKKLTLTVISNDLHKIKSLIDDSSLFDIEYLSLTQNEVLEKLPSFDFGFILRDNLLLNKVSSPIKLLEYASSGVIPILTPYVGDYSKIIKKLGIGIEVKTELTWEMIDSCAYRKDVRYQLKEFATKYMWHNYQDEMLKVFYQACELNTERKNNN
jgi:glycosyltransferase involved in cell wall biosynthesis